MFSHSPHASKPAKSSLNEMWLCVSAGHWNWNQLYPDQAPQPQNPEASEVMVNDGCKVQGNVDTPFPCSSNVLHHCKSARKPWLSQMWWRLLVVLGVCSRSSSNRGMLSPASQPSRHVGASLSTTPTHTSGQTSVMPTGL